MSLMRMIITAPIALLYHNVYMLLRSVYDIYRNVCLRIWVENTKLLSNQTDLSVQHQLSNLLDNSVKRYLRGFSTYRDSMHEKFSFRPFHSPDNLGTCAGLHALTRFILNTDKIHVKLIPEYIFQFTMSPIAAVQFSIYLRARRTKKAGDMIEYLIVTGVVTPEEVFEAFEIEPQTENHKRLYDIQWTELEELSIRL